MANFHNLQDASPEDLGIIAEEQAKNAHHVTNHLLDHLMLLKGDFGGFPIDRYEHCLQTATRAYHDKRDAEYVVCALLHDIGDILAPYNHGEVIAEILRPYIKEENYWMLQHHGIFQGYYFWGKIGLDKNARDKYKSSPHYDHTVEFCEKYDTPSFDKTYASLDIDIFRPLIESVVKNIQNNIYSKIFKE
jgi:predicted HD phosphohydrolase